MTAGVPGSGIGGFFYVLSALLMPFHESISLVRGKSSSASRRTVARQTLNACGVLCGVWFTGWFISRAVTTVSVSLSVRHHPIASAFNRSNLFSAMISLLGVCLLLLVAYAFAHRKQQMNEKQKSAGRDIGLNRFTPVIHE